MDIIVGYSGFVGSNICKNKKFDYYFRKNNIEDAYGLSPDLLVYAGVPAEVFMANKYPEQDKQIIMDSINNIEKINPQKIVLISSVNVYPNECQGDENLVYDESLLDAYGRNRLYLEKWVENHFDNYLIVRLPGIFGENIKKNFIYDLINIIPKKLTREKIMELSITDNGILNYYTELENGFYECKELLSDEKKHLLDILKKCNFSALNFTDSRGKYQYYNLNHLWNDIELALKHGIRKLNIATEPFDINELYDYIYHHSFVNELPKAIPNYNMKTIHDEVFNKSNGYIYSKEEVMKEIKEFVEANSEDICFKYCLGSTK